MELMNTYYSPLEQFELFVVKPFIVGNFDFSLTNATVYMIFTSIVSLLFLFSGVYKAKLIPFPWQSAVESTYLFVLDLLKQQSGKLAEPFFPALFSVFIFILVSNLLGLIPFSFSITGQIAVTLTLALIFNIGFFVLGFWLHGIRFLQLFVPSGIPSLAVPLIVTIEIVSYLLRTFSLSVRLFANIMAGHTLLHILASFSIVFLSGSSYFLSFIPFVLVLAISFLELGIAFLQAYVFAVLLAIYLNDSLHPFH